MRIQWVAGEHNFFLSLQTETNDSNNNSGWPRLKYYKHLNYLNKEKREKKYPEVFAYRTLIFQTIYPTTWLAQGKKGTEMIMKQCENCYNMYNI